MRKTRPGNNERPQARPIPTGAIPSLLEELGRARKSPPIVVTTHRRDALVRLELAEAGLRRQCGELRRVGSRRGLPAHVVPVLRRDLEEIAEELRAARETLKGPDGFDSAWQWGSRELDPQLDAVTILAAGAEQLQQEPDVGVRQEMERVLKGLAPGRRGPVPSGGSPRLLQHTLDACREIHPKLTRALKERKQTGQPVPGRNESGDQEPDLLDGRKPSEVARLLEAVELGVSIKTLIRHLRSARLSAPAPAPVR